MPNWCYNIVYLKHDDPSQIDRAEKALKRGEFMRVILSNSRHWKRRNSCFMTFATKVGTIKMIIIYLKIYINHKFPHIF